MFIEKMQTIVISKEDFQEEAHWIALCDHLEINNSVESIVLKVKIAGIVCNET